MIMLALCWMNLVAQCVEVGSIRGFIYGSEPSCAYDNWLSHVAEGAPYNSNYYAPWDIQHSNFGNYRNPTSQEMTHWGNVIQAWLELDLDTTQDLIGQYGFPYEVVTFQDTDSGRIFYMLRELLNDNVDYNGYPNNPSCHEIGSFDYGWGLYICDPLATRPMLVNVVHPCDDFPAPVIAVEALIKWDARFLFIAGASREALLLPPQYNQNFSKSDPSREEIHPFNVAYRLACDQIRSITSHTEFSVQIHSYDWARHRNVPPVLLSSGNNRLYPALPFFDFRRQPGDFFHAQPYEVFPQNTFGTHSQINVTNYYALYRELGYQGLAGDIPVAYNAELPGFVDNQQMLYTTQDNPWDTYSPFFHIEMSELPIFFTQDDATYRQFWGYDAATQSWSVENRYTILLQFYMPWVEALHQVLDELLWLNDGNCPSNPEDFCVIKATQSEVALGWKRSYDYDFDSYELQIRYQDGDHWHTKTIDRYDYSQLARQTLESITIPYPQNASFLYVRLRARDKNSGYSSWTEELKVFQPASDIDTISHFALQPENRRIRLNFYSNLTNVAGYIIARGQGTEPMQILTSWENEPLLAPNTSGHYEFWDNLAVNGQIYRYQIGVAFLNDTVFWHHPILKTHAFRPMIVYFEDQSNNIRDSLEIGLNYFASDDVDDYDRQKSSAPNSYVWIASKQGSYNYSRDVKNSHDQASSAKCWQVKTINYYSNQPLRIFVDAFAQEAEAQIMLKDTNTGLWHDLKHSSYDWVSSSVQNRIFELWWGFLEPGIGFPTQSTQRFAAGSIIPIRWSLINPQAFSDVSLWLVSPQDSILIAENLPVHQGQFTWQSPPNPMYGYRLAITARLLNGGCVYGLSPYGFDLYPSSITLSNPAGASLINIPILGFGNSVEQLFGPQTSAWMLSADNTWDNVSQIDGFTPYLIDSPQDWQLDFPQGFVNYLVSLPLQNGWNLIGNPHYHGYHLDQLLFTMQEVNYSHAQLAAMGIVSPKFYSMRQGGWELTDVIKPLEATLLYCNIDSELSVTLNPTRNHSGEEVDKQKWELKLNVCEGLNAWDSITIGIGEEGGENYNPLLELPKPPPIPNQAHRIRLWKAQHSSLQRVIKGFFPDYDHSEKNFGFIFEQPATGLLGFEVGENSLPPDYELEISISGHSEIINPEQTLWLPVASGTHYGSITVRNYQTQESGFPSETATPPPAIKIYPNPCFSELSISIENPKNQHISLGIYNLRGQKIRSLHDGLCSKGTLSLKWDCRDSKGQKTAPGVYFIRIQAGRKTLVKKLVLM